MFKRIHFNLPISKATTIIANITKAPFKKCNRNVNELVEGDFTSLEGMA